MADVAMELDFHFQTLPGPVAGKIGLATAKNIDGFMHSYSILYVAVAASPWRLACKSARTTLPMGLRGSALR